MKELTTTEDLDKQIAELDKKIARMERGVAVSRYNRHLELRENLVSKWRQGLMKALGCYATSNQ